MVQVSAAVYAFPLHDHQLRLMVELLTRSAYLHQTWTSFLLLVAMYDDYALKTKSITSSLTSLHIIVCLSHMQAGRKPCHHGSRAYLSPVIICTIGEAAATFQLLHTVVDTVDEGHVNLSSCFVDWCHKLCTIPAPQFVHNLQTMKTLYLRCILCPLALKIAHLTCCTWCLCMPSCKPWHGCLSCR